MQCPFDGDSRLLRVPHQVGLDVTGNLRKKALDNGRTSVFGETYSVIPTFSRLPVSHPVPSAPMALTRIGPPSLSENSHIRR